MMKLAKHAYIESQVLCVLQLYILCAVSFRDN